VGSGLAGYTVIREFRKLNKETPVILLTRDEGDFYAKPTLSNAFAHKRTALQLVTTPASDMATQQGVTLRAEANVTRLDCAHHKVFLGDGDEIVYRSMVLACGADPIRLPLEGDAADAVLSVNDLRDYALFREKIAGKSNIAILGGGLIGCEFANDLAVSGFGVTVIDPAPRPLASLLPPAAGDSLVAPLAKAGIQWRFGRAAKVVSRSGNHFALTLDDGSAVSADLVLSAVGLRPRTILAREAGLSVERGIRVDEFARTSAADVFALGDCAQYPSGVMPYVMPIMHAARAVAQSLAGQATPVQFPPMPVSIKTPSWPIVVQPVVADAPGNWTVESQTESGLKMTFRDPGAVVRGYVLAGDLVKERMAMTKLLAG
jgi:rubredoxin-NAD+ reductase